MKKHRILAAMICIAMLATMGGNIAYAQKEVEPEVVEESPQEELPILMQENEDLIFNNFKYNFDENGNIIIKRYFGTDTEVTIPDEISGIPVKTIGERAFSNPSTLTEITIPGSVETIGDKAFANCTSLQSAILEEGVKSIGSEAFANCYNLAEITIPDSLETIGYSAFYECSALQSIALKEGLTSIGPNAFTFCRNALTEITIPGSVKKIETAIFYGCYYLNNLTISEGVEEIGGYILIYAPLTEIIIPSSVRSIDNDAFTASSLERIHVRQFRGKSGIEENMPWNLEDGRIGHENISFLTGEPEFSGEFDLAGDRQSADIDYGITLVQSDNTEDWDDKVAIEKITIKDPEGNTIATIDAPDNPQEHKSSINVTRNGAYIFTVDYKYLGAIDYTVEVTGIGSAPPPGGSGDTGDSDKKEETILRFIAKEGQWPEGTLGERIYRVNVGDIFTIPEGPFREGYKFLYWHGSKYYPGEKYIVPKGGHTFIAVWEEQKKEEVKEEGGKSDSDNLLPPWLNKPEDKSPYLPSVSYEPKPMVKIPQAGVGQ